jgi:prepilin-type N-terminal cleavage/methylation domain-containing protein
MSRRAFTLIELLIVVAIIAILAAIAVPNFLEAQVRAKIGRVRADMRTAATALESYRIDNNKYPHLEGFRRADLFPGALPNGVAKPGQCDRGGINACYNLTTPIAYLSSVALPDPFISASRSDVTFFGAIPGLPSHTSASIHYLNVDMRFAPGASRKNPKHWYLMSLGPDYLKAPGSLGEYQTGTDPSGTYDWPRYAYDSTNGTISNGDILRSN